MIFFLKSTAKVEAASQALLAIKVYPRPSNYSQKVPVAITGVHLGAYFGVERGVKRLLCEGHKADSRDSVDRTPLSWVAKNGHEAVVRLLLETGKMLAQGMNGLKYYSHEPPETDMRRW